MIRHVEHVMGTVFSLVADDGSGIPAAVARLHEIDAKYSPYRPDSAVSRLAAGEQVDYDAELAEVLDRCAELEAETDGWFSAYPAGRLDPSGWVKGWAIGETARILREAGAVNLCVAGGGDVQTAGANEQGGPWRVGIADPLQPGAVRAVVEGHTLAVATSGVAERGAHIIDPHTGSPASGFAGVTLIGTDIALTDAWATAVFAMGPERGLAWVAAREGIEALGILPDGSTRQTAGFGRYLSGL